MPHQGAGTTSASVRHLGWRHLCFQKRKLHLHLEGASKSTPNTGYLVYPRPDILYDARSLSPLAQVDPKYHDLVTGRWLSVVSTSEPGDLPAIVLTVLCNITQNRCTIQCHSRRKPDVVSPTSTPLWPFFTSIPLTKEHWWTVCERRWFNVIQTVWWLQIACPATTWTEPVGGRGTTTTWT